MLLSKYTYNLCVSLAATGISVSRLRGTVERLMNGLPWGFVSNAAFGLARITALPLGWVHDTDSKSEDPYACYFMK